MAEHLKQEQPELMRAGYFNRDAFRQKGHMLLVLQTGVAGLQFHVDRHSDAGRALLESLVPGTELKLYRGPKTTTTAERSWSALPKGRISAMSRDSRMKPSPG